MQKPRLIWLLSSLALLALVNAAVFGGVFSSRTINLHWRVLAQSNDDAGEYLIVQFAMSDRRAIKSVQVQRLDPDADTAETIWELRGKSSPMDTFSFGSTITDMQRTDAHQGRPRLRPGQTYRITLRASGFRRGELEFET